MCRPSLASISILTFVGCLFTSTFNLGPVWMLFLHYTRRFAVYSTRQPSSSFSSWFNMGCAVRQSEDIDFKVEQTRLALQLWQEGVVSVRPLGDQEEKMDLPDIPMGGNYKPKALKKANRLRYFQRVHGVAYAESIAIQLMWDLLTRFQDEDLPREFYQVSVRYTLRIERV